MEGSQQQSSLPVLHQPVDLLRTGAVAFRSTALQPHPVEAIQRANLAHEWELSLDMTAKVYGQHAAWEKRMDRAALASIQRLPGGPPSSHAHLDSWLGRCSRMGFEDVLNREWLWSCGRGRGVGC
jgi:hypothetical protein